MPSIFIQTKNRNFTSIPNLNVGLPSKRGFTLIELLVVISIISLLSSIVLSSLNSARAKTRDIQRRVSLKQLQIALELYYDSNNSYPLAADWYGPFSMHNSTFVQSSGPQGWIPNLAPTYIKQLPSDPKSLGTDTGYHYYSNGTDYKLLNFQTVEKCPVSSSDSMYDPARNPSTAWSALVPCTFAIYTAGATLW